MRRTDTLIMTKEIEAALVALPPPLPQVGDDDEEVQHKDNYYHYFGFALLP